VIAQGKAKRRPGFECPVKWVCDPFWMIAIDSPPTRTASEGHATLGNSPSVKWVCDPFVGDRDRFATYPHGLGGPCYAWRFTFRKMGLRPVFG